MTSPLRPAWGDSAWMLERTLETLGGWARRAARRLARDDPDLADGVYQEGTILLWELDPARFDERSLSYLARAMYRRMWRVAPAAAHRRDYAPRGSAAAATGAPGQPDPLPA